MLRNNQNRKKIWEINLFHHRRNA